jgi:hypothetical protein
MNMPEPTVDFPAKAGAEIAATYANAYNGDLRIFLHQLCEISAIIAGGGLPYDGHFDMQRGIFEWNRGAVILYAPRDPDRDRSRLAVNPSSMTSQMMEAFAEFAQRCGCQLSSENMWLTPDGQPRFAVTLPGELQDAVLEAWEVSGIHYSQCSETARTVVFMIADGARLAEAKEIVARCQQQQEGER